MAITRAQAVAQAWILGYATALAEIHRLQRGGRAIHAAKTAGINLKQLEEFGLPDFDLEELRKAGLT